MAVAKHPGKSCDFGRVAAIVKVIDLEISQGFNYCVNMAYYEFLIKIKMREIKNIEKGSAKKHS